MRDSSFPADLCDRFMTFVGSEQLFTRQDTLLLAVSGGLDSVVLLDLVHKAGFRFTLAHCNFCLRGQESERDEQHVRALAEQYAVPFHVKRFDTKAYAADHGMSIQSAARKLRYDWFEELCLTIAQASGGRKPKTVTAHHLDDNIETMFFHFLRGTGIAGLRGMLPKSQMAVRPLLFVHRHELESYARNMGLEWVEDSSNASDDYDRNFLRHHVLPLLQSRFPSIREVLAGNLQRFREEELLYGTAIAAWSKRLLQDAPGSGKRIPVEALRQSPAPRTLIWEFLKDYGFSSKQSEEALRLMDAETGRFVASASHRVLRDRSWLSITRLEPSELSVYLAEPEDLIVHTPFGTLDIKRGKTGDDLVLDRGPLTAVLDARDLRYPLIVRKWRAGDYMYPLGMRKKKKLARILIDARVSRDEKEKIWVVESDKRVVWLMGLRMDERFRVLPATTDILTLRWNPSR